MLEFLSDYANRVWSSTLINRMVWAIAIGVVTELLVWLINRRVRRAFGLALQRDVYLDAAERVRRRRVILGLPLLLVRTVLYTVALVIILRYLGFNTGAEVVPLLVCLLALAALIGWRTLHDVVAGYFIVYDNLYATGDRVTIGEFSGTVMEVGLRYTRLKGADGREMALANGTITHVINHTRTGEIERRGQRS